MDMPDKIWVTERHEEMDHPMLRAGMWTNGPIHSRETQYTRTDIAQSLADALEGIAANRFGLQGLMEDGATCEEISEYHANQAYGMQRIARAALANYRKGE